MSKFGVKFDTTSEERRDMFYAALIAAINVSLGPGDKAEIVFEHERPTFRGRRKVVNTVKWEDGEDPPTFYDIGIYATQYEMFAQPSIGARHVTAPINTPEETEATTTTTTEEPEPDSDESSDETTEHPSENASPFETGLEIFRQFLAKLDSQTEQPEAADDDQAEDDQAIEG